MLEKLENNVRIYTSAVKDKLLVINGAAVSVEKKHDDDVSVIYNRIAGLDSSVTELYGNDEAIGSRLSGLDSSVTDMAANIGKLDASVNGYYMSQGVQFAALIKSMDASFADHSGRIDGLDVSISGIEGSTSGLSDRIDVIDSSIESLKATTQGIYGTLSGLDVSIGMIEDDFADYKSKNDASVAALNTSISDIKLNIGVQYATLIKTIDASFADHSGRIDGLDTSINGIATSLSALETKHDSEIAIRDTSLSALETKHDEEIAIRDASIADNSAQIADLIAILGSSTDTSTDQTIFGMIAKLNHIIEENEEIVAQALVDMDLRIGNN